MWGGYDVWTRKPTRYLDGHTHTHTHTHESGVNWQRPQTWITLGYFRIHKSTPATTFGTYKFLIMIIVTEPQKKAWTCMYNNFHYHNCTYTCDKI